MRRDGSGNTSRDLGEDVEQDVSGYELAPERKDQRDGGIEMRARDWAENGDQHDQDGAGGKGVAEQRKRDILGEPLGHDAGAHHRRYEDASAGGLGRKAAP
jgi:hypothetical protein